MNLLTEHRIALSRLAGVVVLAYVLLTEPPKYIAPWLADVVELIGFVLLCIAAFGRIWCLVFIGGKKNGVLLTAGPYSIVRNPLYVFTFLGVVGFGLAVENPLLAFVLGILFATYSPFIVRREEKHLASVFGVVFQAYCARTPRWIPDFQLYREPQTMTVYPGKIREGIFDAMWFLWAFLGWEALEVLRLNGVLAPWF